MSAKASADVNKLENTINEQLPIPKKWREEIVRVVKEQVNQIEEPEEWQDILESWSWFKKPNRWILKTFKYTIAHPATTAYFLAIDYMFNEGLDPYDISKKEMGRICASFRRAVHNLYEAGLIRTIAVTPEEVGLGRNSVTIWVTPWAKSKDIERIKKFYTEVVEGRSGIRKQAERKPKDITLHNRKVQVMTILDKYKINSHVFDYYKCPKKHDSGLKPIKKVKSSYKRKKFLRTCPECNRSLIEIPFEEFIEIKKKILFKKYDIKS